ncbi:unnamed protein product [Calypogeia fissa]
MFPRKSSRAYSPRNAAEMHRGGGLGVSGEALSSRSERRDVPRGRKDVRGSGGVGVGGAGPSRMGSGVHSRQRLQQRKHPEPLRRAIAQCLSASYHGTASAFTSEAVRTLQDYLANSSTMDSAYIVLIDHALAERDRSPPVISKCVALLKRYLFRYVPRSSTLQQIDSFCLGLIAECNEQGGSAGKRTPWVQPVNEPTASRCPGTLPSPSSTTLAFASASLVKSLIYVRALVARHLPRYSLQPSSSVPLVKPLKPNLPSPRSRSFSNPYDRGLKRSVPEDREAAKSAALTIAGLEAIDDENGDYIAVDVLKWRWLGGKGQPAWAPSPVMLDSGGIARPHVERMQSLGEQGASGLMLKSIQQKETDFQTRTGERPRNSLEGVVEEMLLPFTVTAVADRAAVRSHLRAVAAAKRYKPTSQRWDGDGPPSTLRRRSRPLFQYRHYSEQQPLRLSDAEMEEVVMAVCSEAAASGGPAVSPLSGLPNSQTGKIGGEAADVAASVLIKLLIDMYIADPKSAAPLTFSMLQGMVTSQATSVRIRAFDLILNLGVHAHLLEPMQSDDQTISEEPSGSGNLSMENGSFSSFVSLPANRAGDRHRLSRSHLTTSTEPFLEKPERGSPLAVARFEAWLRDILCEMLLLLVQTEEAEEGVWAAALSCLLYLVCDRGRIQRRRLDGVDIRALKILLDLSWEYGWADEVHSRLIRIACNLLYRLPPSTDDTVLANSTLDLEQIEIFGGIEVICEQYARAKTSEAKRNLFAVLFDYVLYGLEDKVRGSQKQFPSTEEIQAVATALCLAEASECFGFAFRQGLSGVGEALAKSIVTAMARDVTSGRLNSEFLDAVVASLDKLAASYSNPEEEFMKLLPVTMASEGLSSDVKNNFSQDTTRMAWSTLEFLLHSPRSSYRYSGYLWLLELLSAQMTRGGSKQNTKLKTNALQRQLGLLGKQERATGNDASENEEIGNQIHTPAISSAVRVLCGLLKSKNPSVRRGFVLILEKVLIQCQRHGLELEYNSSCSIDGELTKQEGARNTGAQDRALAMLGLMNGALWQAISANDTDHVNILQMCNMMFSQLCVNWPLSANGPMRGIPANARVDSSILETQRRGLADALSGGRGLMSVASGNAGGHGGSKFGSVAAMLLNGQAAAPKLLVANMPTALLYWPLTQLAGAATEDVTLGVAVGSRGGGNVPGGVCDVRAVLLLILIGKCTEYQVALDEVGGEEFFRSLLDDMDARVAYYTSAFLLKRMMTEEPEKYQRMLHNLVFKAQQSNNEKLLENPYLQMRGILQLSHESDGPTAFQFES